MASYEFECDECGWTAKIESPINNGIDAPLCCHKEMSRIWTIPLVTFKGTGWGGSKK